VASVRAIAGFARLITRITAFVVAGGADTGDVSGAPTPIDRPMAVAAVTVAQVSNVDDQ
jgi:hypothetical protein